MNTNTIMETITTTQTLYTHLLCSKTNERYDAWQLQTYSKQNKPLLAAYDLSQPLDQSILKERPFTMWRYRELLPIQHQDNVVSLGEGGTPLYRLHNLEAQHPDACLYLKDEAFNPTGSFKARGLSMAISKAKELGVQACAIPTAGNAGGALSAYCAKAGLQAQVYMPRLTPSLFRKECELYGATVTLVDGTISDAARRMRSDWQDGWFDISTLKEPFRLEGKKTMGYEIAEQLEWTLPDVIVYPTGGGTGLIGIWKAIREMEELGWIEGPRPRMVAVQTSACCPIVDAFEQGATSAPVYANPGETVANGLRVPHAFGDELILSALYESDGTAVAISESEIQDGVAEVARQEGVLLSPEGAAVWKATERLLQQDWIRPGETTVMLNTGTWYKYAENF